MKKLELDLLERFSKYLNGDLIITLNQVNKVCKTGIDDKNALKILLEEYLGENELFQKYYNEIINELDSNEYIDNEYYKNINIKNKNYNYWELKNSKYNPYELFVYDDFKEVDGYVLPRIGYFKKPFNYLGVYQNKRLWMSITPNEINTMKKPIINANGNVLVFGLGLGYYQYMISNKKSVNKVTIIEKDKNVIDLFNKMIFPYFKFKHKIEIINDDAYKYLSCTKDKEYDYIFIDIYHDVSDGIEVYNKMIKTLNKFSETKYDFWIFDTIKYYL